jgi:hypothetical protein
MMSFEGKYLAGDGRGMYLVGATTQIHTPANRGLSSYF